MSDFNCTPVEPRSEVRDGHHWTIVTVKKARKMQELPFTYRVMGPIGKGTFGTVQKICTPDGEHYAMKQVDFDPRYKNREVSIMRILDHPNCVRLHYYYLDRDPYMELSVRLIMDLFPTSLSAVIVQNRRKREDIPEFYIRLYLYQLLRGVAYMHSEEIAHRDIKPQNILIDPARGRLKLCDFGSAKQLKEGEINIAYICSRFYRAPELILGNVKYDCSIDTWAVGCVFAEMFLLRPIFLGESSLEQFTEIIRILGTPTPEQMEKLHPMFPKDLKKRSPISLHKHLRRTNCQSLSLLIKLLQYAPDKRIRCWDAMAEPYLDELRKPGLRLPDGGDLPPLFDFTVRELDQNPVLNQLLIPRERNSPRRGSASRRGSAKKHEKKRA
ncbi:glycogen synthase kinase-3 beta-like [Galendromus occidentalis]|uniref:Glycogen synthase kinase-3 beta-like n=1 Tax=Galendromus occidentalis TaxID=34638 RepID=A0AAJ6QZ06_9ACAR|nr:glycogen synthase kinase-3 beta-like [Galendromus occidentalis]